MQLVQYKFYDNDDGASLGIRREAGDDAMRVGAVISPDFLMPYDSEMIEYVAVDSHSSPADKQPCGGVVATGKDTRSLPDTTRRLQ